MTSPTVSLVVDIPEVLYDSLQKHLESHARWDQSRVLQASLSLFLMQNGVDQKTISRLYLDCLFGCPA